MPIRKILFLVVLATLPIQLGKYFFPNYSYILGIPIDYRAQNLYLSDIATTAYIIVSIYSYLRTKTLALNFGKFCQKNSAYISSLFVFLMYLAVDTTLSSVSKQASLFFVLKLCQFSLASIFAAFDFSDKNLKKLISKVIMFSLGWQSAVMILQFLTQKSQGLWILGERSFNVTTPDIAHFNLFGYQLLRPYGTFSHPNVLGAFLVIYIIILEALKPSKKTGVISFGSVILTFSKGAILTLTTALVVMSKTLKEFITRSVLFIAIAVLISKIASTTQVASIAERLTLIQAAFNLALKNPLFGIGSNNFIVELAKLDLTSISQIRLLQPVHNVFLLVLVENGLIGLMLFAIVLFTAARKAQTKEKTALFVAILVFASLDHFLWTLQQGLLMLWLSLAFVISSPKHSSS